MKRNSILKQNTMQEDIDQQFLVGVKLFFFGPFILTFAIIGIIICMTTDLLVSLAKIAKDPATYTSPNNPI